MDTVTHGLIGAVVARSGFQQRLGVTATVALVVGALLPDVDFVMGFVDQMAAVKYHRGLTHSFLGAIPLAMTAAAVLRRWQKAPSYWILAGLTYLGMCLHILSDLPTSYGTMIFFPLSTARYALDWVFIVDPVYTAILLAGLLLGWRRPPLAYRYARLSLLVMIVYVSLAALGQQIALARFKDGLAVGGIAPEESAVFPELPGLVRWLGIARAGSAFYEARLSLWESATPAAEAYRNQLSAQELAEVAKVDEVQAYLRFARFPWVRVQEGQDGRIVEFRDLRFGSDRGRRESFLLRVVLDAGHGEPEVFFNHRY